MVFILFVIFGIQFLKTQKIIPLSFLFSPQPLSLQEYGWDLKRAVEGNQMKTGGQSFAYDPTLLAGYPAGTLVEPGSWLTQLLAQWLAPIFPPAMSIKWIVFLIFLFSPLCIYLAARLFELNVWGALVAFAISVGSFADLDFSSRILMSFGWYGYIGATYLTFLSSAFLYRWLKGGRWWHGLLFVITLSFIPILDFSALALMFVSVTAILTAQFQLRQWRKSLIIPLALFFIGILYWNRIEPAMVFRRWWSVPPDWHYWLQFKYSVLPWNESWEELFRAGMRLGILFFGLSGIILIIQKNQNRQSLLFLFWAIGIILLSFLGNYIPGMDRLIPIRFLSASSILLAIPAGFFISQASFFKDHPLRLTFPILFLWFQMTWMIKACPSYLKLSLDENTNKKKSISNLITRLPKNGRILIEDPSLSPTDVAIPPLPSSHEYLGLMRHLSGFLHTQSTCFLTLGVEKIWFLGREFSSYTAEELVEALERYNIQTVVIFTKYTRAKFLRHPERFSLLLKTDQAAIFRVIGIPPSYLMKGTGDVQASVNRIEIKNPSQGDLLLKYHWLDSLQALDNVRMWPQIVGNDPVPFIAVANERDRGSIVIKNQPL